MDIHFNLLQHNLKIKISVDVIEFLDINVTEWWEGHLWKWGKWEEDKAHFSPMQEYLGSCHLTKSLGRPRRKVGEY